MHRLNISFISLATVIHFRDLCKAFFHEILPSFRVGIVIVEGPCVVALDVFLDAFGFDQLNDLVVGVGQIALVRRHNCGRCPNEQRERPPKTCQTSNVLHCCGLIVALSRVR